LPDVFTSKVGDAILYINRKRVKMVVDESVSQALNRIADCLEDNNETLKKILSHYNSVVPPMKEGADRSNKYGRMAEERGIIDEAEEMRARGHHN